MRGFVIVVLLSLVPFPQNQEEGDFNIELFNYLSAILQTTPPERVEVEVLSNMEMRKEYAKDATRRCIERNNIPPGPARLACAVSEEDILVISFGKWIYEDDPSYLHIIVNHEAGLLTVIHEFFHWWIYYRTDPPGLLSISDETAEDFATFIMASYKFSLWLEEAR